MNRATRNSDFYSIRLSRHTGMIILGRTQTATFQGTLDQCLAAYRAAQKHNLIFGW